MKYINHGKDSIGEKIKKKVVLALCGQNGELFDLSQLNDISLQLMPRVLELVQKHSQHRTLQLCEVELDRDALSRLFHTLRGWGQMPLLFGNLRRPTAVATRKRKSLRIAETRRREGEEEEEAIHKIQFILFGDSAP